MEGEGKKERRGSNGRGKVGRGKEKGKGKEANKSGRIV